MMKFKKLRCILGLHDWDTWHTLEWVNDKFKGKEEHTCRNCGKIEIVESGNETDTNQNGEAGS